MKYGRILIYLDQILLRKAGLLGEDWYGKGSDFIYVSCRVTLAVAFGFLPKLWAVIGNYEWYFVIQ